MISAAALLLALPIAAPPQDQASVADLYQSAVSARLAGDPARAVALLRPVVAANPRNPDAQVQLGLAQLALGQLDAAEAAFRAALTVAPDYNDARVGLARIAQRRGDIAGARRALEPVDETNADAAELRRQLATEPLPARWQIDLETSLSDLSGPQPDWTEAVAQLRYRPSPSTAIGARIEYARRFGRTDVYGEALLEGALGDGLRGYLSFGAAADPDFRPQWQIGLGGSARVHSGPYATVLILDARQARLALGDVQSVSPGIEQYLGGRFWITARWINLFDEDGRHQSGYLLRGDLQASDPLRLFFGYSDAPDTDEGIVIPVRSVFGGVSIDLSPRATLRLSLAHEDRATGADRTQFGVGTGFRF
ncbi:YaiO family outer membrane beta-barrel protein [Sphingomonas sp. R647]|uniref:YaiO family outer membrane beta-barrel protein n=1 Tax=Sphingomonas sp. R647 TaxID=2875233 RepID=UPI001CD54131|nr:YaiO family outer membrane beta-barrel protein [Sphingomonas sp. R647]MCA1196441.1 YaiO family outer membrane beta-barrel protein [Sphingomonas sp. R647]